MSTQEEEPTKGLRLHFVEPIRRASSIDTEQSFRPRPRSNSHHLSSAKPPSRTWLLIQARTWRFLMSLGAPFHDLKFPKPPRPSFVRTIPTSPAGSTPIRLLFYIPPNYSTLLASGHRFPLVVNFHGGGFCLGNPSDDRYWFASLLKHTTPTHVVVSVGYRLAPENPFPVPLDDAVDALLYLSAHSGTLGLDTAHTTLSGFSAGANLAFTTPLRLKYHTRTLSPTSPPTAQPDLVRWSSTLHLLQDSVSHPLTITSIIAFYPLLDWTESRASKKRSSVNPAALLPKFFTDLFDNSYLPCPDLINDHASPYASPALADGEMLRNGLPSNIQMFLCEYDMLLREGTVFTTRLEELGKYVATHIIPGVPHGWDKSPNPFRDQDMINRLYEEACKGLNESFNCPASQGKGEEEAVADGNDIQEVLSVRRRRTSGVKRMGKEMKPWRLSVSKPMPI
jgi:putative ergosteryl-3beta-O-L-aspartate hydrolase